jgi:hypothetical protein
MAIEVKLSSRPANEADIRPRNNFGYHGEIVSVYGFRIDRGYSYVIIHSNKFMSETLCVPLHEIHPIHLTQELFKLLTTKEELSIMQVSLRWNVKCYELIMTDKNTGNENFFQYISYVHEMQNLFHDFTGSAPSFPINLKFAVTEPATSSF